MILDLSDILSIIETIALVLTLIFIALQTRASNKSVNEIKKSLLQSSILSDTNSTNEIYRTFLNHPDIAKKYGYKKIDVFNLMIIEHFEARFLLRKYSLVSDIEWKSDLYQIKKTMNRDFVKKIWEKDKNEFDIEFVKFVATEIFNKEVNLKPNNEKEFQKETD